MAGKSDVLLWGLVIGGLGLFGILGYKAINSLFGGSGQTEKEQWELTQKTVAAAGGAAEQAQVSGSETFQVGQSYLELLEAGGYDLSAPSYYEAVEALQKELDEYNAMLAQWGGVINTPEDAAFYERLTKENKDVYNAQQKVNDLYVQIWFAGQ